MGFINKYPYTDFHELNLDWFLEEFKKVTDKVTDLDTTVQQFTEFVTNYFDNLDVQQEVNNKIDELVANGTIAAILQPFVDSVQHEVDERLDIQDGTISTQNSRLSVLEGRMDEFASLPPGSTAGNAELLDIRVGVDGITYASAGDAVREQVRDTNESLSLFNMFALPQTYKPDNVSNGGVVFDTVGEKISAVGTALNNSVNENLYFFTLPNGNFKEGSIIYLYQNSSDETNVYMEFWAEINGSFSAQIIMKNGVRSYKIPANTTRIIYRIHSVYNVAVNATIEAKLVTLPENDLTIKVYPERGYGYRTDGTQPENPTIDLNDIRENSVWLLTSTFLYTNNPAGVNTMFLQTYVADKWVLQVVYAFSGGGVYKRHGYIDGTSWEAWQQVGGGSVINNTFNSYSQSVTLNATPTINADTNNYLAASGDTTDRTADILSLLSSVGVCNLGPGEFYVQNLIMPDNTEIHGSGNSTILRLIGTGAGYAVSMGNYCTVENLRIKGASSITVSSVVGNRHGILFAGDYTNTGNSEPFRGMIRNVYIENFSGGGITCYDTGVSSSASLLVSDSWIVSCSAGINISYQSEFHKFTNVSCKWCYYGAINNGGNNSFVNCDFSNNTKGMLLDNGNGQSPNNSHGNAIGCIFNHSDNNSGIGIHVLGCTNGFVFDGCQIFFSKTIVENSDGVIFSNCNYGYNNCDISVTSGGTVLFMGDMFQAAPPIMITGNSNVHFTDCYVRSTGAIVSA